LWVQRGCAFQSDHHSGRLRRHLDALGKVEELSAGSVTTRLLVRAAFREAEK
jgi:hypothetical protein